MSADLLRDVFVNERMIRRRVATHEVHGGPVFLARFFLKGQPREVLHLVRQIVASIHGDAAVVLAHLGTRTTRTAVREERDVFARLDVKTGLLQCDALIRRHGERAKLHEMGASPE